MWHSKTDVAIMPKTLGKVALTLLAGVYACSGALAAGWETTNPKDAKAFESGNVEAVKQIFVRNDYFAKDPKLLLFALRKAVASGNVELANYLKTRGWFNECRKHKCYPIHVAASHGQVPMIKWLVSEGYDVREADDADFNRQYTGNTPLHYAAQTGTVETVRFLCEQGVDPTTKNRMGQTALDEARAQSHSNLSSDPEKNARLRANLMQRIQYLEAGKCRSR